MAPAPIFLDLNSALPDELDGEIVIPAGEAVADEDADPLAEAEGVHVVATLLLDINSTPPAEFYGLDINSTPQEESDGVILPRGVVVPDEEIDAIAQDEEANAQAEAAGVEQPQRLRNWLTDAQRYAVYTSLYAKSKRGKLPKTATKEVAAFFHTHIRVIQKIWKIAREQIALGMEVDVSSKKAGRCGRKPAELDVSRITSIPLNRRSTLRSLAKSLVDVL